MSVAAMIPDDWQLPSELRERLGSTVGRQRCMVHDGHLLLVLHAVPRPDDDERHGRFFWRTPDGAWRTSHHAGAHHEDSNAPHESGIAPLERHVLAFADAVEECDQLEEQAKSASEYFAILERLAPLHRTCRNLHLALQDAREALPNERSLIDLRDLAYQTERNAELLYGLAKNGLDFAVARRAEEQAEASRRMEHASHRLNQMAALFLPLATLAAVMGVNLRHGLEDQPAPGAFLFFVAIGMLGGMMLAFFVRR